MENQYLIAEYTDFVKARKETTDKYRRIYNQLDRENVGAIIRSGDTVYVEGYTTPQYILKDIEKWIRSKGLGFIRC